MNAHVCIRRTGPSIRTRASNLWTEIKAHNLVLVCRAVSIMFTVFVVVPIIVSIGLSFTYFNMVQPPVWVGWQNYLTLFLEDEVFFIAVKKRSFSPRSPDRSVTSCALSARGSSTSFVPKCATILTLMFYAPSISANAYLMWTLIFSGDAYGYINGMLLYWGVIDKPILWLQDPQWMMTVVIIVVLWMSLGVSFLTFYRRACRASTGSTTRRGPSTAFATAGRSSGTSRCR